MLLTSIVLLKRRDLTSRKGCYSCFFWGIW